MTAFKNGQVGMIVNGPWSTADVLSGPAFKSSTNFRRRRDPRRALAARARRSAAEPS